MGEGCPDSGGGDSSLFWPAALQTLAGLATPGWTGWAEGSGEGCPLPRPVDQCIGPWQDSDPRTQKCPGASLDHWCQTRKDTEATRQPSAGHTEGLSATWRACRPWRAPSARGLFSAESGLAGGAAQLAGGPGKENQEEMKKSVAQVFCVMRGGLGAPRPSPGDVLSTRRGQLQEAGIWQMASVWGLGEAGNQVAGLERLLDLLGPLHVVCSRLLARQALDEVLQAPPEAHLLQGVVEPACGDAEVGLVG